MSYTNLDVHTYTMTDQSLVKFANQVKDQLLEDLANMGYLSDKDREAWHKNKVFIGYRPSWFGRTWRRLWSVDTDEEDVFTVSIARINHTPVKGET